MEKKKEETTLKEQIDALAVQVEKLTEQVKLLSEMTGKKKRAAKGERTDKQKAQQEKFKTVSKLAAAMKTAYMIGMRLKAKRKGEHPRDVFKRINLQKFYGSTVDYKRLQLSYGTGNMVELKAAKTTEEGKVRVEYGIKGEKSTEENMVFIFVFCKDLMKGKLARTYKGKVECECDVPEEWKGKEMYVYAFSYSNERNVYSNTSCINVEKN